jgi:HAMP domain-containing protein
MTALGLLERVKGWLGGGNGHGRPKRATLEAESYLARGNSHAAAEAADADKAEAESMCPASSAAGSSDIASPEPHPSALEPLDPEWMQSLEELPRRIAENAADSAAGVRSLEQIAGELEGHRQSTRTIAATIKRLPDLALAQGELSRETNKILDRQSLVLESMLDGVIALRAAFKSTEESSQRHLKAIAILETSHRQILFEYQMMFLRTHRRLGYLAAAAAMLAAGALGGVAYVAWYVFATS